MACRAWWLNRNSDSDRIRATAGVDRQQPGALFAGAQARTVWIGDEHPQTALQHCAVVQASYRSGDGSTGQVALIGPMRMAYATARAAVTCVARTLNHLLS